MFDLKKQLKKCDNYDQVIISKDLMTIKTIDRKVLPVYNRDDDGDNGDDNSNDDINEDDVYTRTYSGNDNVYNRNCDYGNNKLSSNNEKESSNDIDKDDDDNDNDYNDSIDDLTAFSVEISRSLYELLINIQKLLTPPPINISQKSPKEYHRIIIAHLRSIHNANEFDINNGNFFIRIDKDEKKKKGSLNFILNKKEEEERKEKNEEKEEEIGGLIIKGVSFKKIPFQQYSSEKLVTLIINLYNLSMEEYMSTEIIRCHQFRYYLLILECYEKLQTFCYNNNQRK